MIAGDSNDRGFQAYLQARAGVQRIAAAAANAADGQPSQYWAGELEQIDYLAEASPLIIRKLRHHAFHITGVRPYDYRDKGDGRRQSFEARLQALRALDGGRLLVPESPALGGFGYEIDGALFNVDTLKFYEVLIGMERAGALAALRRVERPLVCEIGAGWGGFAYQLKTLFPGLTYVVVDFPELFLFSATYLQAVFPDAVVRFVATPADMRAAEADFVFVPNALAPQVASLPLDLAVNMVSFQEMTDAQVRSYARIVADAGCPLLYSLNRERSPYNSELASVSEALSEQYRLEEVDVLDDDYTSALKKRRRPGKDGVRSARSGAREGERQPDLRYRHQVGRLRRASARAVAERRGGAIGDAPPVVLGMTLYNNARHLREALDSILAQTFADFRLVMLDDASVDDTERIAREYAERDGRIRYFRHPERQAMIATWHEVVGLAERECPSASYFAWVSDHDRWDPRWLETLVRELDRDSGVVLAYPVTRRIAGDNEELDKGPRLFETAGLRDLPSRWSYFCRHGVGAGDMVYGLMRLDALRRAGTFRTVLRPDRLLVAELTLWGRIRQVADVLWYRRQSGGASVSRQRQTLVLPGREPKWFSSPPWLQHALVLWREYVRPPTRPLPIATRNWMWMLAEYQVAYGWRHLRKTETSHAIGRGIDNAIWAKKITRHYYHHAVYHALVGGRMLWGRSRRLVRRGIYHVLVFTHRLGLRGGSQGTPTP